MINSEEADVVKKGYEEIAESYRKLKDFSLLHNPVYKKWFTEIRRGSIVDLGCGSGFPIAQEFFKNEIPYLGIDFSESQIKLAKKQYPLHKESFLEAEMFEWCRRRNKNTVGGVLALFSIFHLPRKYHIELFIEIKRILEPKAPFLLSVPEKSSEGSERNWLGVEMFWSSFSHHWYKLTLSELNFFPVSYYRDEKDFLDKKEVTWYLLHHA
ncbi:MAG: class I SAM-dependent methyltransferase [Candidatus Hodarchaeales archaeon]